LRQRFPLIPEAETPKNFPVFRAGDALRGLTALAVIAFHAGGLTLYATGHLKGAGGTLTPYDAYGALGRYVFTAGSAAFLVFFALTGYLIGRPFVQRFVLGWPTPAVRAYCLRRAFRIFPPFLVVLAGILIVVGTRGASGHHLISIATLREKYAASPLAGEIAQAWTLHVELVFYLVVPTVSIFALVTSKALRLSRVGREALVWLMVIGGAFASYGFSRHSNLASVNHQRAFLSMLIGFIPGLSMALWELHIKQVPRPWAAHTLAAATFATGGLGLVALTRWSPLDPGVTYLLASASCGLIFAGPLLFERIAGRAWPPLDWAVMRWLGTRSYSIYLLHLAVMEACRPLLHGMGYVRGYVVLFSSTLAGTFVLAEICFRLVERPSIRLGRRLGRDPNRQPAAAPSTAVATSSEASSALFERQPR
jgi:peptidoglycan/LPS O-acetylase OafA/YrhL